MNFLDTLRFVLSVSSSESQRDFHEAARWNNLAINCEASGDGHTALEYYVKALEIISLSGDLNNKALVLNNVGGLLKNHGSWLEARDCFYEIVEITHENNDRVHEAAALSNLGIIYMNLNDFEAMLKFEHRALERIQSENHPSQESVCRSGIALALHKMGRTIEALPYLQQSISLLESRNLVCDANGTSTNDLCELLQTMQQGEEIDIFSKVEVINAMKAFITAANWEQALQIFNIYRPLLSPPEVEATIQEGIIQMRQVGEIQMMRNLQAHLKLLRRAKKHSTRSSSKNRKR